MTDLINTAVIGHPIEHSLSPLIHNHWIAEYGLRGEYAAVDIMPDDIKQGIQNLIDQGYAGFNVTIPHKEAVLNLCQYVDEAAQKIGAVNTVKISENGSLSGFNTDHYGFIQNIKAHDSQFDFAAGGAMVLGAGGAARAVIYGLCKQGVPEIRLANRTMEKAEQLALDFPEAPIDVVAWDDREYAAEGVNMLVNTTALGMSGMDGLDYSLDHLASDALVTDIVYNPLYTDLLQAAKMRGNACVTGIGMLLHQARPAFEKWYGVLPQVSDDLTEKVLEALR